MTETGAQPPVPPGRPLGVIDAMREGWRLLMTDFWNLWLLAFVRGALVVAVGVVSCFLCCLAPVVGFFLEPPLAAGLFRGVARRIDRGRVEVVDLFAAFQSCYWPAVLAGLPVMGIDFVLQILQQAARLPGDVSRVVVSGGQASEEEAAAVLAVVIGAAGVGGLLALALGLVRVFFYFALAAVWDTPGSGAEAIRRAAGLFRTRFWPVVGLGVLFMLLHLAAGIVGLLACVVGLFITLPAVTVWQHATMLYLYRQWMGQPLVQTGAWASAGEGPAAPSDAEPPSA